VRKFDSESESPNRENYAKFMSILNSDHLTQKLNVKQKSSAVPPKKKAFNFQYMSNSSCINIELENKVKNKDEKLIQKPSEESGN